jgi:hypothetical protein
VHSPPPVAGSAHATQKLYDAFQAAILGKTSAEAALHTSAKQATDILSANKKKYG